MPARSSFYFCNDLAALALKFNEHLQVSRRKRDPLIPFVVLVPNRNVARWLQMFLAESQGPTGVCANVQFRFLEDGIKYYLGRIDPQKRPARVVSRDEIELHLLETLLGKNPGGALGSYLTASTPRKTHQLAARLASLFQEYEYHRQNWIGEWNAGKFGKGLAAEQGRLYAAVWSSIRQKDSDATSLGEFATSVFADLKSDFHLDEEIFVFAVSQISDLHRNILFSLSDWLPVQYFVVDIAMTGGTEEWRLTSKPSFKAEAGFPRTWLDPQRKTILAMQGARKPAHDWYILRSSPPGTRFLTALQQALVKQPARKIEPQLEINPSVQVFACPGVFREAETVFHSIMLEMRKDPHLTLTDIAVLVPDMATYRPALESIFEREVDADGRPRIPFSITDFSSNQTSVFAQGVEALLDLVDGTFTRSELFQIFTNACFQERFDVTGEDVAEWLQLVDALGIHRGRDGRHSFHSGLKRLRLGFVMQGCFDSLGDSVSMHDPFVDERAAGVFSQVIADLESAVDGIRSAAAPDLSALLKKYFDSFLGIPEGMPHEKRVSENLASVFVRLDEFKSNRIGFEILREIIVEAVQGLSASRGEYLANGVTISALQPMRPIPFKIIYVMGMSEGKFPGRADESDLDLRNSKPMPTDVSLPEANRVLLLEAIMSAKEKLIITYNSRDIRRDASFELSSAIKEVIAYSSDYAGQVLIRSLPLSASHVQSTDDIVHVAPGDQAIAALRVGASSDALLNDIARRRTLVSQAWKSDSVKRQTRQVTLKQLSDYLTRPLDTVMRQIGHLYADDAEDLALKNREPVFADANVFYGLGSEILRTFFMSEKRTMPLLEEIARTTYRRHAGALKLPLPGFGEADLLPMLSRWEKLEKKWTEKFLHQGAAFQPLNLSFTVFPEGYADGVEIVAAVDLCRDAGLQLQCIVPVYDASNRSYLFPFLLHQLRKSLSEPADVMPYQIAYGKESFKSREMRSVPNPVEYLTALVAEFLSADSQFIPFELVEDVKSLDLPSDEYSRLLQSRVDEPGQRKLWREELVELVDPKIDQNAKIQVKRRFGTFLEMVATRES